MSEAEGQKHEAPTEGDAAKLVTLGYVSGLLGVRGWVKVFSDTDPREGILGYQPWYIDRGKGWETWTVEQGRRQGHNVVAKLAGCDDREAAAELVKGVIAVRRDQLKDQLQPGEYYWTDLEGLEVVTIDGTELGRLERLFETGANDVMVVKGERERLIPYLWDQVVREVDLDKQRMVVDWDPEF